MRHLAIVGGLVLALTAVGCGGDDKNDNNNNGGTGGTAGTGGTGGTGGTAGEGAGGTAGTGGTGGTTDDAFDLTLEATGFEQFTGAPFYISVYDGSGTLVAQDAWTVGIDLDADFSIPLADFIPAGDGLKVDWFVDADNDGMCGEGDPADRFEIASVTENLTVTLDASATNLAACESFKLPVDLTLVGTGMAAFEGQNIWVSINDGATGEEITSGGWTIGTDGEIDFNIPLQGALTPGNTYRVDYWIDASADGLCGEGDFRVRSDIPAVTGPVTLTLTPETTQNAAICDTFGWAPTDFVLEGANFGDYEGKTVALQLFASVNGQTADAGTASAVIVDGAFSVRIPTIMYDDYVYSAQWFVDVDADQICGAGDVGGSIDTISPPFDGHVVRTVEPSANAAECSAFPTWAPRVEVSGSGFGDWEGKYFEVYLIDPANPADYAGYDSGTVQNGAFEVSFPATVNGPSYDVYWFVDGNQSFYCELPADNAGSSMVGQVTGVATVSVSPVETSDAAACDAMNAFWE